MSITTWDNLNRLLRILNEVLIFVFKVFNTYKLQYTVHGRALYEYNEVRSNR